MGVECWSARELQGLLGYSKWENFFKVLVKAKDLAAEMTSVNVQAKDLKGQAEKKANMWIITARFAGLS